MSDRSDLPRDRLLDYPGTLRLLSHAALADVIPRIATDYVDEALAETIQRAWLFSGGAEPFVALPRFRDVWRHCKLPDALISALDDWLISQRAERTYDVPAEWASLAPRDLYDILREILHAWSEADGTIVFVRLNNDPDILPATLLPFILHDRSKDTEPLATSQNGSADDINLDESVKTASEHARRKGWIKGREQKRIALHTLPGRTDVPIVGASGGLPILISLRFRHAGLRVPVLRIGASGVLTDVGGLSSVAEIEQYHAKQALFTAVGVPTVILPEPMPGGWPCGKDLSPKLDALVADLQSQYGQPLPAQLEGRLIDFKSYLDPKRYLFTGRKWLLEKIELWSHDGGEHALLIVGDPGSGKTSIAAELLHRNPEKIIAHHCCEADEKETLQPGRFVQSIAAMLASKLPEYRKQLDNPAIADALGGKRCEEDPSSAFSEGILNPLYNVASPHGGLCYILIDALDEAVGYDLGSTNIVELLAGRLERMPTWLRVIATTRSDSDVLRRLSGCRSERIEADDPHNTADLAAYIQRRLETPQLAGKLAESGMSGQSVISLLEKRSTGNFLYAVHALNGVQFDNIRFDQLVELPPGLDGIYLRFIERIFQRARPSDPHLPYDRARSLIEVMVAAREPMTVAELSLASELDAEVDLPHLLRKLSQFISRRQRDGSESTFAFYHKSLADWLTTDHEFRVSKTKGQQRLANLCIAEEGDLTELSYYVRQNGIAHLAAVKDWNRVAAWLSNLHFIEGRAKEGEIFDLQDDYNFVLQRLPEALEENLREQRRRTENERWTREIIEYSAKWSARRKDLADGKRVSTDEPVLPKAPRVVERWSHERISAEVNRINETPTRLDSVRGFSAFVANNDVYLARFCGTDGFIVQQAFNSSPSGVVHEAGTRLLSTISSSVLIRSWRSSDNHTEISACVRMLNGFGPVQITADGNRAVSTEFTYEKDLVLWDLVSGHCIRRWKGHGLAALSMDMTPDGRVAICARSDNTVCVFDLESCKPPVVLEGHTGDVNSISITPDGRRAVSTSSDNTLRVWNLEQSVCERVFDQWEFYSVSDIHITTCGRRAYIGGSLQALQAWDLEEGGFVLTLVGQNAPIKGLAITPDERRAATVDVFGGLLIWDLKDRRRLHEVWSDDDSLNAVELTPGGESVISAGPGRTLILGSAKTGEALGVMEGHSGEVLWVSMTIDGRRAISASWDSTLRVWDLEKGGRSSKARDLEQLQAPIVFDAMGKRGVSGEVDGTLRIWDLEKRVCATRLRAHSEAVRNICLAADARIAVSIGKDNFIRAWDLETKRKLNELDAKFVAAWPCLSVSPDGQFAFLADIVLYKWHIPTGKVSVLEGQQFAYSLNITADGRFAISAHQDETLRVWDIAKERCEHEFKTSSRIRSMNTTPDGRCAVFISSDKPTILTVLDLESGQTMWTLPGAIEAVVTPDGRRVVVVGDDECLQVYDVKTGSPYGAPWQTSGGIGVIRFSPSGRFVVYSTLDVWTLRRWDLEEGGAEVVVGMPSLVKSVFIGDRSSIWVACCNSDLVFLSPQNFPTDGPLITTASRLIYSPDAAPGPAFIHPPCCAAKCQIPRAMASKIDAFGFEPPPSAFSDATLLFSCPNCGSPLRINPFVLDVLTESSPA